MRPSIKALCAISSSLVALSAAAQAANITGRVSDQSGEVSLEGAIVRVVGENRTAATNRAGEFRITGLPAGEYTLRVSYLGAEPKEITVTIPSDDAVVSQDVRLGDDLLIVDNILVVGQRGALNSALNQERSADDIRTVLSADAIGQLPDENVAEAARRAVGVNVLNDQGEGRFVSIRGLDPNLNSSSINGVRLPSPEGDNRSVPLDVIDSDLLAGIVITKSLTPDMDGDAIGGNVDIKTLSGLDRKSTYLKLKAAGNYANITSELGQKYSAAAADNFLDGTLGVAAAISFKERKFGSDNIEVDDASWNTDNAVPYPDELEMRDYRIERERIGAAFNVDYRPNEELELYVHSLFSKFRDQEFRARVETKFDEVDDPSRIEGTTAFVDELEVDRDIKDREEVQTIYSVIGGGKLTFETTKLDWFASYSYADEEEPNRIDTAFRGGFDGDFGVNVADTIIPELAFGDDASRATYFDTDEYEFDELELVDGKTTDEEFAMGLNLQQDLDIGVYPGMIKLGGKARFRRKERDITVSVFDGFDGDDLLLSQFPEMREYRIDQIGVTPDPRAIRSFFNENRADFELSDDDSLIGSREEDYEATENIYAGYIMSRIDMDKLRLTGGIRFEATQFDATGNEILEAEEGATVNGETLDDDAIFITAVSAEQKYLDWLPSMNARYEIEENLVARFAYYKSVIRPNIGQVVPAAQIERDEDDELEGSLGNPTLERQRAHNVDLSIAWYPTDTSVLMVGAFYKDLKDFIAIQNFENFTFQGQTFDEASIAVNLEDASLLGFEVNYQQALDFLPNGFDGLIVGANYTYIDGEATLSDGREIALPQQSEHVANVIIGYEKGPINVRAVGTYRDEYIDELNLAGDGVDRIVDDHLQIDLTAKYALTDQFTAFIEAKNITNEPFIAFVNDGGFNRLNSQFEEYGYSLEFGVSYRF